MHRTSTKQVSDLISFAETGQLPLPKKNKQKRGRRGCGRPASKVERYKELVVRLHDKKRMPFMRIRQYIKDKYQESLDYQTVIRAYDCGNPEPLRIAAETGARPNRGIHRGLGKAVHDSIRRYLMRGDGTMKIAKKLGVSDATVRNVRKRMELESNSAAAE